VLDKDKGGDGEEVGEIEGLAKVLNIRRNKEKMSDGLMDNSLVWRGSMMAKDWMSKA
jgi:hypothetical protein